MDSWEERKRKQERRSPKWAERACRVPGRKSPRRLGYGEQELRKEMGMHAAEQVMEDLSGMVFPLHERGSSCRCRAEK